MSTWRFAWTLVILASGCAARPAFADAQSVLAEATEHFRAGAAELENDHAKARDELTRAISGFHRLIDEFGVRNGAIFYNIGNAHLLLGDAGPAILNYRRAARFIRSDPNLAANLDIARQRVPNRIDAPASERVRRTLLFWHDESSPASRFRAFLWVYAAGWILALARTAGVLRIGGWWLVAIATILAASLAASLFVDHRAETSSNDAVVIAPQTIGRKGPDAAVYEPSFTEPLHGGVEVTIVERRPGWTLVRLGNGRDTWIAADHVEPVRELR
jgi:hypothetical protein